MNNKIRAHMTARIAFVPGKDPVAQLLNVLNSPGATSAVVMHAPWKQTGAMLIGDQVYASYEGTDLAIPEDALDASGDELQDHAIALQRKQIANIRTILSNMGWEPYTFSISPCASK